MTPQGLTLNDVTQSLGIQQVFQARHLLFELTHQSVIRILIDDGVTANLFGTVGIPKDKKKINKPKEKQGKLEKTDRGWR